MSEQVIGLLLAHDKASLQALAKKHNWTILPNTGFPFEKFMSDDDHSLKFVDGMDALAVYGPGCAVLAYRNE